MEITENLKQDTQKHAVELIALHPHPDITAGPNPSEQPPHLTTNLLASPGDGALLVNYHWRTIYPRHHQVSPPQISKPCAPFAVNSLHQ